MLGTLIGESDREGKPPCVGDAVHCRIIRDRQPIHEYHVFTDLSDGPSFYKLPAKIVGRDFPLEGLHGHPHDC